MRNRCSHGLAWVALGCSVHSDWTHLVRDAVCGPATRWLGSNRIGAIEDVGEEILRGPGLSVWDCLAIDGSRIRERQAAV